MTFLGGGVPQVSPGMYRLVLMVDGVEYSQPIRVEADPNRPGPVIASDEDSGDDPF